MAPRTGPLIRAQGSGGPAWRTVVGVMPGTTSRAGRTSTRAGWASRTRRSASRLAASTSSRQRAVRSHPVTGGRHSTWLSRTPRAASASAKWAVPTLTTASSAPKSPGPGAAGVAGDAGAAGAAVPAAPPDPALPGSALTAASGEVARQLGGQPVGGTDEGAGGVELPLLVPEALRVLVGADHVGHHRERPPGPTRPAPGRADRGREGARGVGVRSVAEDQVDEQHGDLRIVGGARRGRAPERGVDDRMRPAARVRRVPEVDQPVCVADDRPGLVQEGPAR